MWFFLIPLVLGFLIYMMITWPTYSVGTKSLLVGVHQFLWHPVTVYIAWVKLNGSLPGWRETACIVFHDWGYWGCESMDGEDGMQHPHVGARIAGKLFGPEYYNLVLRHSRHLAAKDGAQPSILCWADKTSMMYDPMWFYLIRARLSGEIHEYVVNAIQRGDLTVQNYVARADGGKHRALFESPNQIQKRWFKNLRCMMIGLSIIETRKLRSCQPTTSLS